MLAPWQRRGRANGSGTGRARGTEQTFSTGIDVAAANNEDALPGRMGNLAPRGVAHPEAFIDESDHGRLRMLPLKMASPMYPCSGKARAGDELDAANSEFTLMYKAIVTRTSSHSTGQGD